MRFFTSALSVTCVKSTMEETKSTPRTSFSSYLWAVQSAIVQCINVLRYTDRGRLWHLLSTSSTYLLRLVYRDQAWDVLLEVQLGGLTEALEAICGCNSTACVFQSLLQLANQQIHAFFTYCAGYLAECLLSSLPMATAGILVIGGAQEWRHDIVQVPVNCWTCSAFVKFVCHI